MDDPGELRLKILLCMEIERDSSRGSARKLAAMLRQDLEAELAIVEARLLRCEPEALPGTRPPEKP
jgi:hypothetical protein